MTKNTHFIVGVWKDFVYLTDKVKYQLVFLGSSSNEYNLNAIRVAFTPLESSYLNNLGSTYTH